MKNYVVGYGSLINFESQNITAKTNISIPITLKNFTRSWSVTYDEMQFCALGVYRKQGHSVNAVLFDIEDLQAFDKREHGYNRIELKPEEIALWLDSKNQTASAQTHGVNEIVKTKSELPNDGRFWIYLPFAEKKGTASEKYLIWQSYVDVILLGCLSISLDFAKEFIQNTEGLNPNFFHDDRKTSEYLKALKHYDSLAVDALLSQIKKI